MPKLLSQERRSSFAARLAEYAQEISLTRCAVIFHGGEPLLAGAETLAAFATELRAATSAHIDVSLQTNGLLLDDATLDVLEAANIGISLSIDGPRTANDKHRLTRKGRSSFDQTQAALIRLQDRPKVFAGVITVVDASTSPDELFRYFNEFRIPRLDFLLPDAHHLRPPPGRNETPGLYENWMVKAFDLWLDQYSHLAVRTFEALLDAVTGLPSGTDAFGYGDVSLISIETDGSYHDLDVLKVTKDGATRLFGSVADMRISDIAGSASIQEHRSYLQKKGLCEKCQSCSIVDICGGGSLPHRYGANGFANPTIYCGEMLALVTHASKRLSEFLAPPTAAPTPMLSQDIDLRLFDLAEDAAPLMELFCEDAEEVTYSAFVSVLEQINSTDRGPLRIQLAELSEAKLKDIASHPGAIAWCKAYAAQTEGRTVLAVDGTDVRVDESYLHYLIGLPAVDASGFRLAEADPWLRTPFGNAIDFDNDEIASQVRPIVMEALAIIEQWRPALAAEMRKCCHAIQFVRDPLADPNKIVSFSDNSVPGALYVSVVQGDGFIDPYDLADSLIHEHRHQKLYLLERLAPTVETTSMLVDSPWREDPRPPSGLLHAVFVFTELRRFWIYVRDHGPDRTYKRSVNQISDTDNHLQQAFLTLEKCPLTDTGQRLVKVLKVAAETQFELCGAA